jgi:hypothetical protein
MSERERNSLLVTAQEPIDEILWAALHACEANSPATYNQLKIPKEELKKAKELFFGSDASESPDLRVTHLEVEDLAAQEIEWKDLKQQIIESDLPAYAKQAYRWRANEEIANRRIVKASATGDMARFKAYNEFIYGTPDPKIFAATADWFRQMAWNLAAHESPAVQAAADEVLELVPDLGGDRNLLAPDPEIFERIKQARFKEDGYFALILAGVEIPDNKKIPEGVGDPILRQALNNIGAGHYELTSSGGAGWSADNNNARLNKPEGYNWMRRRFIGLPLGHEALHILEYQNGLRQRLKLFSHGLDRYENGNEGRAVINEQVAFDTFEEFSKQLRWQDIMRRYFAVSLALGIDGHPRDFSEVYKIMNAVDRMWNRSKKPHEIEGADEKARDRSWDLLAGKTFVGTDGRPGVVYQKNAVYLPGNMACWNTPDLVVAGDAGKFDIANPRHIAVAQAAGVLP